MNYGETHKHWNATLAGKEHSFRFEHQFWTGEKKYFVNDELIKHVEGNLLQSASFGSDVPFDIDGHNGVFQFRAIGRLTFYDLYIDGSKIEGEEKSAMRLPPWAIVLSLLVLLAIAGLAMQFG